LDKLETLLSDAERVLDLTRISVSRKKEKSLNLINKNIFVFVASTR